MKPPALVRQTTLHCTVSVTVKEIRLNRFCANVTPAGGLLPQLPSHRFRTCQKASNKPCSMPLTASTPPCTTHCSTKYRAFDTRAHRYGGSPWRGQCGNQYSSPPATGRAIVHYTMPWYCTMHRCRVLLVVVLQTVPTGKLMESTMLLLHISVPK